MARSTPVAKDDAEIGGELRNTFHLAKATTSCGLAMATAVVSEKSVERGDPCEQSRSHVRVAPTMLADPMMHYEHAFCI